MLNNKKNKKGIFMRRNSDTIFVYVILLVVYIFFAANQSDFLSKYGQQSIFNQIVTLCIVVFGQTLVVITGGIDLSIGNIVAVTNCLIATIMSVLITGLGSEGLGIVVTVILALILGMICGLINGLIIVFGRMQAIIVTLATSMIFGGVASYIRPQPGGNVCSTYVRLFSGFVFDTIPITLIVILLMVFVVWIPFRKTRLGQSIYAIGGNEYSAYISGVKIRFTKVMAYTIAGLFAGFTGVMLTAQTASGDALGSVTLTMNSIAAVVLGGVALTGGKGSYIGAVAGAAIMSLILGLMIFWGISSFYQSGAQGAILILALAFGLLREFRYKKRTASLSKSVD